MSAARTATELLSPRAFGLALGVTRQAVMKAIVAGRLRASLSRCERTGRHLVDLELGRQEWRDWTDPAKQKDRAEPARGGRPKKGAAATPSMFDPDSVKAQAVRTTLATTRTEQVALDVELKRLELAQRQGALVDRREVQREAFRLARAVRDRLQAIPDRIAANLAALEKPGQVHQALAEEIARALETLGREEEGLEGPRGRA